MIAVSGLFVYPVKSLRGVAVRAASLIGGRFAGDREYLVLNRHGQFMDQRRYPQMTRVAALITSRGLRLRASGVSDCEVLAPTDAGRSVCHVQLWRRSAPVTPVGPDADRWLSEVLSEPCRLMAFAPQASALNVPFYEVHSSLQDATPFHITSEESLADLNQRAGTALPMNRFRPNIVVSGATAYAEDSWRSVTIDGTSLRWIKACARCVATTTDQFTGERKGSEPLATLNKYRREGSAVVFGHYFMAERCGAQLHVGDPVHVVDAVDPPVAQN